MGSNEQLSDSPHVQVEGLGANVVSLASREQVRVLEICQSLEGLYAHKQSMVFTIDDITVKMVA